ncbi:MAG: hypothetical protein JXR37_10775 [Kiritimatiellae bacterium]|nr:hypothetical protein [Kiritimatiellia bacterium]
MDPQTMRYITPAHLFQTRFAPDRPAPRWAAAVLCFRDTRGSQALLDVFGAEPLGYKAIWGMDECGERPFVYRARAGACDVGVVAGCLWGGPQAAILVEELAALGVKHLVGYGAAGSFVPDLRQGEHVVAVSALPIDGTSRAYGAGPCAAADGLLDTARGAAQELGVALREVTAVTTDAVYRETPALVAAWRAQGAQVVNMETSAFYAAARVCGVRALWLGHVSDCLADRWEDWHIDRVAVSRLGARLCRTIVQALPN